MDIPGLLSLLLTGLILGWLLLSLHTVWLLTHPPRRGYGWAVARSLPGTPDELRLVGRPAQERLTFDRWTFRSQGLDHPVWDIKGLPGHSHGPLIILTHGWGDSRTVMLGSGRVAGLLPLASRLVVWDMRSHGDSPARLCTLGEREAEDLCALIDHLTEPRGADPARRVVLYGFSLGAMVSLRAGFHNPRVSAIVAEAPYTSPWVPARNVLFLRGLPFRLNLPPALLTLGAAFGRRWSWIPTGRTPPGFCPAGPAPTPVLILHGDGDLVAPIRGGREVAASMPGSRLAEIPRGAHQTLWSDPATGPACAEQVAHFLRLL